MSKDKKSLYYLDELSDYKVKNDDPDVRGWDMKDRDNRVIGKVDDFLVHKERGKVVYLDVEIDQTIIDENHDPYAPPRNNEIREFVNKEGENHVIVPIGMAEIDEDHEFVIINQIDYRTFAETKRIQKGYPVNREYEEVVLGSYDRGDPQTEGSFREKEKYAYPDDDTLYERGEFHRSRNRRNDDRR